MRVQSAVQTLQSPWIAPEYLDDPSAAAHLDYGLAAKLRSAAA